MMEVIKARRKKLRRYLRAQRARRYAWGWASMHDIAKRERYWELRYGHTQDQLHALKAAAREALDR